jgi:hypothetical protein
MYDLSDGNDSGDTCTFCLDLMVPPKLPPTPPLLDSPLDRPMLLLLTLAAIAMLSLRMVDRSVIGVEEPEEPAEEDAEEDDEEEGEEEEPDCSVVEFSTRNSMRFSPV